MILVIIGPSGSGKAAAVTILGAEGVLHPHATFTDRAIRPDDKDSIEHVFISKQEFDERLKDGFFLGTAELFTNRFGMAPWPEERNGLLTVILRANLVDQFVQGAGVEKVIIYQIQAPRERLAATLAERSLSNAEFNARLAEHDGETALGTMIADRIFNNEGSLKDLVDQIREAVIEDTGGVVDLSSSAPVSTNDDVDLRAQDLKTETVS